MTTDYCDVNFALCTWTYGKLHVGSVTAAFDGCAMTLLQDGKLHLVITHDGQVDREVWFESTHRLNDNQPHRVVVRRNDRYVSIRLTHYRRRRSVVVSVFRRMNEVTLRRAR